MKKPIVRIIVVLRITLRTNISVFIGKAQSMYDQMLGNASFPLAQPLMAQFQTDINALRVAESKASTKLAGAVAFRDAQKVIVFNQMETMRGIVQTAVNDPLNRSNAVSIAQSAGMDIKGHKPRAKGELTVIHGKVSGSVILMAHAVGVHAAYEWQQSTDNTNWVACNPHITTESKNELFGLTPGVVYYFRFKPVLPKKSNKTKASRSAAQGEGDLSQAVKIMVI